MAILTREDLSEMEEYYYWSFNKKWIPFSEEFKGKLLEMFGEEPFPYTWFKQDIHEGIRKIIRDYFNN